MLGFSSFVAGGWLLAIGCVSLIVVACMCCVLFVGCLLGGSVLFVVCCLMFAVVRVLFVACCWLLVLVGCVVC